MEGAKDGWSEGPFVGEIVGNPVGCGVVGAKVGNREGESVHNEVSVITIEPSVIKFENSRIVEMNNSSMKFAGPRFMTNAVASTSTKFS